MKAWRRVARLIGLYLAVQQTFAFFFLASRDPHVTVMAQKNAGFPGKTLYKTVRYKTYSVIHEIDDGIERIIYRPHTPRHETPIVMQHGMWHGAWCWERWQRILAEQGWESHAHSLPGHALSPTQRLIWLCTLDYYLSFLKREMDRHTRKPILMGHSMGGALAQWYLKYVDDALPAAVLVGPWVVDSNFGYAAEIVQQDFFGMVILPVLTWSASAWVRSPYYAAQKLISPNADMTPEDLYAHLSPESALVLYQHNPPFWTPPTHVRTPVFLAAGALDTVCPEPHMRRTAQHYSADYYVDPGSAHNLMMDGDFTATVMKIHEWLEAQNIP